MKDYQAAFIESAIASRALCFGEFTLKSGRTSPYFFNAGQLYHGRDLAVLARSYAAAIAESGLAFDVVFGPAYKGIPLAALTAAALHEQHGMEVDFAYNRKEAKSHGEGGHLVGAPLKNQRVLIIDDVITAGTAVREITSLLEQQGARLTAVVIGLNRQEKGQSELSAVQEVEQGLNVDVVSIINLNDIISYLEQDDSAQTELQAIKKYCSLYGVE